MIVTPVRGRVPVFCVLSVKVKTSPGVTEPEPSLSVFVKEMLGVIKAVPAVAVAAYEMKLFVSQLPLLRLQVTLMVTVPADGPSVTVNGTEGLEMPL